MCTPWISSSPPTQSPSSSMWHGRTTCYGDGPGQSWAVYTFRRCCALYRGWVGAYRLSSSLALVPLTLAVVANCRQGHRRLLRLHRFVRLPSCQLEFLVDLHDDCICMYCGVRLAKSLLFSQEHIPHVSVYGAMT